MAILIFDKTVEKDHGRIEEREYFLTYDISSIKDKEKQKTVKAIAYTKVTRTLEEETFITDNYYVIYFKIDIKTLEESIIDH